MSWWRVASCGLAMAGIVAIVSCGAPLVQVPPPNPTMCLPTAVTPERLVGDVVASNAIQPGVSSVRLLTPHGEIVTYWNGKTLIGIDLEPDNKQTPIWMREPGEGCVWRYGKGREA